MKYKVNEIFYSIQGEGFFTGQPAVFIRFSGCNLKCPWCDTKHEEGQYYTKTELEKAVDGITHGNEDIIIVFTGGEPTLQLSDEEILLQDYFTCIETNGTNKPPKWVDWVTCSPKTNITFDKFIPNEIKVVYEPERKEYLLDLTKVDSNLFLQPLEKEGKMNIEETLKFIKQHPEFRLSLQTHKLIGVR